MMEEEEGEDESADKAPSQVYVPGKTALKEGEELVHDSSTYHMYHAVRTTCIMLYVPHVSCCTYHMYHAVRTTCITLYVPHVSRCTYHMYHAVRTTCITLYVPHVSCYTYHMYHAVRTTCITLYVPYVSCCTYYMYHAVCVTCAMLYVMLHLQINSPYLLYQGAIILSKSCCFID